MIQPSQSYFVSFDNVDYVRDAIGLENKYVGYVYLVDWEGRIRWAGCGGPWNGDGAIGSSTDAGEAAIPEGGKGGQVAEGLVSGHGEVQRLEICTNVLMGRLDKLIGEGKVS
jgi:mitochondrial ATPase complex subunit ATP10